MIKAFGMKETLVVAHIAAVLLAQAGMLAAPDVPGAENALSQAVTAGLGLISQSIVIWKYLHHHGDKK